MVSESEGSGLGKMKHATKGQIGVVLWRAYVMKRHIPWKKIYEKVLKDSPHDSLDKNYPNILPFG